MTASDLDIYETARRIIEAHGGSALYLARSRLEECGDLGNLEGADDWRRIIAAIEFLQAEEKPERSEVQ